MKKTKKKGFTLFEMLTAIAVLALLGVMITVGTNLATQSLNKSMYIANSSLLSDTVNKAMSDVLRYSVPTNGQNFEETDNVKFSCDIYAVDNGNFKVTDGLIILDFGNTKVHDGNTEVQKSPAPLVNAGAYTGLAISNLKVSYNETDKIYSGSYTIRSNELNLEKDCSFTVKPFDIKYQQGIVDDDLNWDNPTDIHRHNLKNWTYSDEKMCYATCSECGQVVYRNHVISDEALVEIDALRRTLKNCDSVFEGEIPEIICVNCGGNVPVTITSTVPHNLEYAPNTGDTAATQHTVRCTNPGCTYTAQESHNLTLLSYDQETHTLKCICGYTVDEAHVPQSGIAADIENKKDALQCGTSEDYEYICKVCSKMINIKIDANYSEHEYYYPSADVNETGHNKKCEHCDYHKWEDHKRDKSKPLDGGLVDSQTYHGVYCVCGQLITKETHRPSLIYNSDGTINTKEHSLKCECGYDVNRVSEWLKKLFGGTEHKVDTYTLTNNNTQHVLTCACGYNMNNNTPEDHTYAWTMIDGEYHAEICTVCKYEKEGSRELHPKESLNYTIKYTDLAEWVTDKNKHTVTCSKCNGTFEKDHVLPSKGTQYSGKEWDNDNITGAAKVRRDGDDYHRLVCICGYIMDYEEHKFDSYESISATQHQIKCSICGKVENTQPHTLVYIDTDANQHRQVCANCDYKSDNENHQWVTKNDNTQHWQECSLCHYKKDYKNHTIEQDWTTDGSNHWKKCTGCSYTTATDDHKLSYKVSGNQHWQVCSVCEYATAKTNHSGTGSYQSDATNHWKLCVCGEKVGITDHTWGNATEIRGDNTNHKRKCTICNYEKTEAHVREISKKSGYAIITGDDEHNVTCSLCGKDLGNEPHVFSYTSTSNKKHTRTCACGYSDEEGHSLSKWTAKDSSSHTRSCSICQAPFTENHDFNRKGVCSNCGYTKST